MSRASGELCKHLVDYMINDAKIAKTNKANVQRLLSLLQTSGSYTLLGLDGRNEFSKYKKDKNINPFIIPIAKSTKNDRIIGYMRWPTQKEDMELQIVSTNQVGLCLESLNTIDYCYKMVIEMDNEQHPAAQEAVDLYNKDNNEKTYNNKDYQMFLEKFKGKFPLETAVDKRLALDRFLLNKFSNFPDVYQRLANNLFLKNNSTSALITCEMGLDKFYGYGHPISFHADLLSRIPGSEKEASHAARSSMRMPVWTCASTLTQLESTVKLAGFSSMQKLGEMHFVRYITHITHSLTYTLTHLLTRFYYFTRSSDPREKDIAEKGISPAQISLDQAAHLMDAVALGHVQGGWNSIIEPLAKKYHDGGHIEIAAYIQTQLC